MTIPIGIFDHNPENADIIGIGGVSQWRFRKGKSMDKGEAISVNSFKTRLKNPKRIRCSADLLVLSARVPYLEDRD